MLSVLCVFISVQCSAQVRISLTTGDTLKGKVRQMIEYSNAGNHKIKNVYTCDTAKKLEMAKSYDQSNNDKLMGTWLVKYDNYGHIIEKDLRCGSGLPCLRSIYEYDAQGREIKQYQVHHHNTRNYPISECNTLLDWLSGGMTDWMIGIDSSVESSVNEYDTKNHLVKISEKKFSAGPEHRPDTSFLTTQYKYNNRDSVTEIKIKIISYEYESIDTATEATYYKYSNEGLVVEMKKQNIGRKLSFDDSPKRIDTTVEEAYYKYDNRQNRTEEILFSKKSDGTPADSTKIFLKYDDKDILIEKKVYSPKINDDHSQPDLGKLVGNGWQYTYDGSGKTVSNYYKIFRKADGLEIKSQQRDVPIYIRESEEEKKQYQLEYDNHGNVIKKTAISGWVAFTREIAYH